MKFLFVASFIGLAVYLLTQADIRAVLGLAWRRFWLPIVVAVVSAMAFFVWSYGGDAMRLF